MLVDGYPEAATLQIDDIRVFGASSVSTVTINGGSHDDWDQDVNSMVSLECSFSNFIINVHFTKCSMVFVLMFYPDVICGDLTNQCGY